MVRVRYCSLGSVQMSPQTSVTRRRNQNQCNCIVGGVSAAVCSSGDRLAGVRWEIVRRVGACWETVRRKFLRLAGLVARRLCVVVVSVSGSQFA